MVIEVIASRVSDQFTKVPTNTASFVAVLITFTFRNLISSLCASTPSVTCLINLVDAICPEPQPVSSNVIDKDEINFLMVLLMAKGYLGSVNKMKIKADI